MTEVARICVFGETPLGDDWHSVYWESFGTFWINFPGYPEIRFERGRIVLKWPERTVRYETDYDLEWYELKPCEIETVIRMEAMRKENTRVTKYYDIGKPPYIWMQQVRAAQITATNLPNDLQRYIFCFLLDYWNEA